MNSIRKPAGQGHSQKWPLRKADLVCLRATQSRACRAELDNKACLGHRIMAHSGAKAAPYFGAWEKDGGCGHGLLLTHMGTVLNREVPFFFPFYR